MNYLQEHNAGSIIRCTSQIYKRNFLKIVIIYALPAIPAHLIFFKVMEGGNTFWIISSYLALIAVGLFAMGSITVAVSDICVGNPAAVIRSYKRLSGSLAGRLFVANLLQSLLIGIGSILLIVPGILMFIWYMFVPIIIVLENSSLKEAFRRSKALGKGFYWRNLGILMIFYGVLIAFFMVVSIVVTLTGFASIQAPVALTFFVTIIILPILFVTIILIYYDMRVRKEGYDSYRLSEDLRR